MDLNLIAIVVLILLAIVLAISIFKDSKKTTSLLGSLAPPNLPNLPIYLRNFLDAKINAKELLTIIKLY